MADFGGFVRFNYAGNPLRMRGHITIQPTNVKADGIANQDSSTSRTIMPKGYVAKMKFEDGLNGTATPQPWDAIIKGGPYNINCIEDMTGVTHLWTGAKFTGEPEVDREKGEVTGLSIIADTYRSMRS